MMRKLYDLKFWGKPNPHLDAVETCSKPGRSDCETSSAKSPAHTEASSNFAEDVSMTEYNSFVEESTVQPSDPAGEVRTIGQNGPRATQQNQRRQMHNLRNKTKWLSRSLAKEQAANRELKSKLHWSEKYNGPLQVRLAAHEGSSQPHEGVWIDLSNAEHDTKVLQEEAAALRNEMQAQKETQKEVHFQLKGAMRTLQERLTACQQEVRAYKTKLHRMQDSEQDLQDAKKQLAASQEAQAFDAELLRVRENEEDLRKTREKLAASQQELRACKDDLFRLQPVVQTTDADISMDFESLCQRINDWIEGEISLFEDAHPNAKPGDMFSAVGSAELKTFLHKYSEAGEYPVRYIIHHHLQEIMFDKDVFLFGIPQAFAWMLRGAEESMAMLEPRREYTTIATWRSETLTAISAHEGFVNYRRRQLDEASRHVFGHLSSVFPIINRERQSFARFYKAVMFPAAELASKVQASATTYEFVMPKDMFSNLVPVHMDHLARFRMVEVKTGKTLKPDSKVVPDNHGCIGKFIMRLEPSLHRTNRDQRSTTLYQACYLVQLDKPLVRGNKALT